MKAKKMFLNVLAVVLSTLVISCASAPEMSAEEEKMSAGGETQASASVTPSKEEAAPASTTSETETASAPSTAPADPGISESAGASSSSLESLSETKTEPTLVAPAASESKASEILTAAPAPAEALPLSGDMTGASAAAEEKVATDANTAATVDTNLDTSSLSAGSNEPTLAMPTLDTPKQSTKAAKRKGKKSPKVSEVTTPASPAVPMVAAAQEVDTQPAKAVVSNQVSVTEQDGAKLNRFYFLRPGDHTEKVSDLLYGNRAWADKLIKWNGGVQNWIPGNRIVYQSPVNKNDTTFLSYYEEGGVSLKEYRVQKGDNLKTLAAKFYGDIRCWSELAHINQLTTATTAVSEGVVLKFAPERLNSMVVSAQSKTPDQVVAEAEEKDPFLAADKQHETAQLKKKDAKSLASAEVGGFILNNLFLIVTVTLVLGLVIFMIKRRDKDNMEF